MQGAPPCIAEVTLTDPAPSICREFEFTLGVADRCRAVGPSGANLKAAGRRFGAAVDRRMVHRTIMKGHNQNLLSCSLEVQHMYRNKANAMQSERMRENADEIDYLKSAIEIQRSRMAQAAASSGPPRLSGSPLAEADSDVFAMI